MSADFSAEAEGRYREALERREAILAAWKVEGEPLLATGSTGQLVEHPLVKMLREHDVLVDRLAAAARIRHRGPAPSAVLSPSIGKSPPRGGRLATFAAATGLPAGGVASARTARHRPAGRSGPRSSRLRSRRVEARGQDSGERSPAGAAERSRARRARPDAPRLDSPLIFPAPRGGYIDLHNWRAREWIPAVRAAGFTTAEGTATKRIYDLRHTFATFAIHALVPSFIIARVMGTSEAMLRKHYGHLLPDTDDLVRDRLNSYSAAKKELSGTERRPRFQPPDGCA